jgi:hypothetical protein
MGFINKKFLVDVDFLVSNAVWTWKVYTTFLKNKLFPCNIKGYHSDEYEDGYLLE